MVCWFSGLKKFKKCSWFDTMHSLFVDHFSHCTESTVCVSKNAMHLISYLLLVVFCLKDVLSVKLLSKKMFKMWIFK